ncbi:MAG: selenocysteine-specific translation elongation factor [Beijerinckiaceae bacterium]
MKVLLAGVMGHVDHGKTALVRALTGVDTDRLASEKQRGVSIELGFAPLRGADVEVDLIDMPGHERFVRAMAGGATSVQAAILVVCASEGVRTQTVEHLQIARCIGVENVIGVVAKADTVEPHRLGATMMQVRRSLCGTGYFNAPVLSCSAVTGAGLDDLKQALFSISRARPDRDEGDFAYLPIDRAFVARGLGPVVAGALRGRSLSVGDEVELWPGGRRALVRGMQRHGRAMTRAVPGRRIALNLKGIEADALHRGAVLATPGALAASEWLDVILRLADGGQQPLRNGDRAELIHGHAQTRVRVRTLDGGAATPGDTIVCQLRAETPLFLPAGESFVLRRSSPPQTFGGGRILASNSARRRRTGAPAHLLRLAEGDMRGALTAMVAAAGANGVPVATLRRVVPVGGRLPSPKVLHAMPLPDGSFIASAAHQALKRDLLARLGALHDATPLASGFELSRICPITVARAVAAERALSELAAEKLVERQGARWRRSDFDPERAAPLSVRHAAEKIERIFLLAGLEPPSATVFQSQQALALKWLLQRGVLVRTVDRVQQREVVFHAAALHAARRILAETFGDGSDFRASEAGAVLGVSRKFAIPLLEYLDARGFTMRIADRRRLRGPAGSATIGG